MAGYSKTSLVDKLGIREGFRVKTTGAPGHFQELIQPLPAKAIVSGRLKAPVHIWHVFARSKIGLEQTLRKAIQGIPESGVIWVSWPKKSSGVLTDMTEDEVRKAALPLGLVDVKVCAIDDIWSGLKLMKRKANRRRCLTFGGSSAP